MGLKSKSLNDVRTDLPIKEVLKEDFARVNINIPVSLRKKWKNAALNADKSMSQIIVEAMSKYLSTQMSKDS